MKMLVVGAPEDVAGFALAGVDGVVCRSVDDVSRALALTEEDTLVLVSAEFAGFPGPARLHVVLPARS